MGAFWDATYHFGEHLKQHDLLPECLFLSHDNPVIPYSLVIEWNNDCLFDLYLGMFLIYFIDSWSRYFQGIEVYPTAT
jgi:hypothetical protein